MSDYLWDKSGEPGAEIERLEDLLGALRHQPRALELPDATPSLARRHTFFRPALAVAAALVLMLLAGVWFNFTRQRRTGDDSPSRAAATQHAAPRRATTETTETTANAQDGATGVAVEAATPNVGSQSEVAHEAAREKSKQQVAGVEAAQRWRQRAAHHASSVERRQRLEAVRGNVNRSPGGAETAVARTPRVTRRNLAEADLAERQMAKRQLMLALRLTTDKLSFVQAKTNERMREPNGARPALEEQNRLR